MKRKGWMIVVSVAVLVSGIPMANAVPIVPAGYTIGNYITIPGYTDPTAIAFAPEGGGFGYAGQMFLQEGNPASPRHNFRVDSAGHAVPWNTVADVESFAFAPPGSQFGDRLYGLTWGTIYSYTSDGTETRFALASGGIPTDLMFSPGGHWGNYIYTAEGGSSIRRYDANGVGTSFVQNQPRHLFGLAFSPGGAWGDYLYACYGSWVDTMPRVDRIDPNGVVQTFMTDHTGGLGNMNSIAFGTTGIFAGRLFVSMAGEPYYSIYEITPDGNTTLFASGFDFTYGVWADGDIEFGPDGAMYLADGDSGTVWRIVPEPATLTLLAVGGLGLLRRRRRA